MVSGPDGAWERMISSRLSWQAHERLRLNFACGGVEWPTISKRNRLPNTQTTTTIPITTYLQRQANISNHVRPTDYPAGCSSRQPTRRTLCSSQNATGGNCKQHGVVTKVGTSRDIAGNSQ